MCKVCCGKFSLPVQTNLGDVGSAGGGGGTQPAASERAAGSRLGRPLSPLGGRRHRRHKVVDDREAVGRDAVDGLPGGQTSAGLLVHLGETSTVSK